MAGARLAMELVITAEPAPLTNQLPSQENRRKRWSYR